VSRSSIPEPALSQPVPDGGPAAHRPAWHGNASVGGAVCGLLMAAVAMGVPGNPPVSPYLVVWGTGLVVLITGGRFRGRARQFGVGLVASGLVGPTLMALGLAQGTVLGHP